MSDSDSLERKIADLVARLQFARSPLEAASLLIRVAGLRARIVPLIDEKMARSHRGQATADYERAIALTPESHPLRVEACAAAALLYLGTAAFVRDEGEPDAVRRTLDRALLLVRIGRSTAERLNMEAECDRLDQLEAHVLHGSYALLGERAALQRALDLVDAALPARRDREHEVALIITQYEQTGESELIERGIELAELALPTIETNRLTTLLTSLSNLLLFRAARVRQAGGPAAEVAADANRAVELARLHSAHPDLTPDGKAAALNALAQAILFRAEVARDVKGVGEAASVALQAVILADKKADSGRLYLNNAAVMLARLADIAPDFRAGIGRSPRDDAIVLLETALEDAAPTSPTTTLLRMNLALQLVERHARSADPRDVARAVALLEAAEEEVQAGHPQRASMLDLRVQALAQNIGNDRGRSMAAAIDAAVEAEAIAASGAPVGVRRPRPIDNLLDLCGRHGIDLGDLGAKRIRATDRLARFWPEHASRLAVTRARSSLAANDLDAARSYATLALQASERAMLVADNPDWAREHAASIGDPACRVARHVAARLAPDEPLLAVSLLEQAQAGAMSRLRWSTADLHAVAGPNADAAVIDRYAAARGQLHALIEDRRAGKLSATAEVVRAAETDLERAARALSDAMDGFEAMDGRYAGYDEAVPRAYLVAGEASGIALFIDRGDCVERVVLSELSEENVALWLARHRAAIQAVEDEGAAAVPAFRRVLSSVAAWMRDAAGDRLRDRLADRSWVVVPCGTLCGLPWSAVCSGLPIGWAPSLRLCSRARVAPGSTRCLLVADPAHDGQNSLPDATRLHEWLESTLGEEVTLLTGAAATPQAVVEAARAHREIVFYAHGAIEPEAPLNSGLLMHGLSRLDIRGILASRGAFEGKVIVLAACSQGRFDPEIPGEMLGPSSAFLAAGARVVIAPSWPVEAISAQGIACGLLQGLRLRQPPAVALVLAQARVRESSSASGMHLAGLRRGRFPSDDRPVIKPAHESDDDLFFRAAFAVYGRP